MKNSTLLRFAVTAVIAGSVTPAFSNTMSIPSDDHAAYTVDVPSDWKPKISDETVEAVEPGNHVYLSGWIVTKSDVGELSKDIADTLKDSMKSVDEGTKEEAIENNGIKFTVVRGTGTDKREGGKVTFMVAIFPAGAGKAGIFYADWDSDAPADITQKLNGIMNSIKLKS